MPAFKLVSSFEPTGDQPEAIKQLTAGLQAGYTYQTLLGVTGSGKTHTMARVIEATQRPALIIAHNKTLAGQLYNEFREFFPENAVDYFISYYDYYQPEAYVPHTDTYIEKDSSINEEIDKMRHSATSALTERRDVIIIASVSCIYGLGSPEEYREMVISLRPGMNIARDTLLKRLVENQYERNEMDFHRGTFRARGDVVEVFPIGKSESALRIEFFGDEIERILEFSPLTGEIAGKRAHVYIYPASHYIASREHMLQAAVDIEQELEQELTAMTAAGKLLEAQRLGQRTRFDLEMIREIGVCKGIENYSRYITGRLPGEPPFTLIDFFPEDFIIFIDESHMTIPQIGAMFEGDRSRKRNLVDYGFRLPSAMDNRPLTFTEFETRVKQAVLVSATPGAYELQHSAQVVEQIIRPTGLVDPQVEVRPTAGQIDDLMAEIRDRVGRGHRVLVTTLTKRMAEDLTEYLGETGIKVRYMHSDIGALERMEILRSLRLGEFDVLVGINLLREGLDLPEVSLVAILDADKEGFLRSERALIQTMGRAARNIEGRVIMYADRITPSMQRAMEETDRRREIQEQFNREHNIEPQSIIKEVQARIEGTLIAEEGNIYSSLLVGMSHSEQGRIIADLENEMRTASEQLDFEKAARIRDMIEEITGERPSNFRKKKKRSRR